jgi:hypothetical protein
MKDNRKKLMPHAHALYRKCLKLANMFGKLNDWRRIQISHDRLALPFMSASVIVAMVTFWIPSTKP